MSKKQKTLKQSFKITGKGLHTGKEVTLVIKPAPDDYGFKFIRVDTPDKVVIPADAKYVTTTNRNTCLEKEGKKIQTPEHLLAALLGMDLDNAEIEVDAEEIPIMDGSAKDFVEKIKEAGVVEQKTDRSYFNVTSPITYKEESTGSELTLIPSDNFSVLTVVDFGKNIVGTQNASLDNLDNFETEVSTARTFSFLHEIESLLEQGLIKGGDLKNAIIYVDKEPSTEIMEKLKKIFNQDSVSVRPNGILDNLFLNFKNEAARHKLLDVIGDISLVGKRIKGKIIAHKPGHKANTNFAKIIQRHISKQSEKPPVYDPNKKPLYDINQIMKILPHRPPFLLVDRVHKISDTKIIASKCVTMNEPFFVGHFPINPVMPGVLQVEAMAQAGGIFALNGIPDPENYLTYFMKIENVKFKKMVVPGDVLIFDLNLLSPLRRGICHMHAKVFVGETLVSEAELLAKIVKEK